MSYRRFLAPVNNVTRVLWHTVRNSGVGCYARSSEGVPISGPYEGERRVTLIQISAATKALQAVALELLDEHLAHCVADALAEGGATAQEKVARVSQEGPGLFLNIEVKPAVNFRELEQVMILTARAPVPSVESNG